MSRPELSPLVLPLVVRTISLVAACLVVVVLLFRVAPAVAAVVSMVIKPLATVGPPWLAGAMIRRRFDDEPLSVAECRRTAWQAALVLAWVPLALAHLGGASLADLGLGGVALLAGFGFVFYAVTLYWGLRSRLGR